MNKIFSFCKGLLLLCLFSTGFLQAQKSVSDAYATEINEVFKHLDLTKVPQRILVDYGMEFADLATYNGTLIRENILHRGHYTAIYNTLLMSRTQTNVAGLVDPDTFIDNWDNLRQENKIVISGLYYKYNEFKPDAPNNTITITDGKLFDKFVGGVWQNPYDEKQVFAMAAPLLKYNSLTMQVEVPATLWYTNQASAVAAIAIDFGDGAGYQTITLGQARTLTYTQPGLKEWNYRLTLTNSQILYSHSQIFIDAEVPTFTTTGSKRTINQPCAVNGFGIDEVEFFGTRQYLGKANSAILEIDYAGTDGCGTIQKPLIVVEGFDLGLSGTENHLGEIGLQNFRNEALFGTGNLPNELNTYDIIYVNWKSGRDYMQRNAYLLEDIIKWVNAQKAAAGSTIPNVVLGQSMGGVIARYALRDMEKQQTLYPTATPSWGHQTSLYISHDAPHQGANIPLAIQAFARHMIDQFISTPMQDFNINMSGEGGSVTIKDLRNVLNEPGTKQLLSNYVLLGSQGFDRYNTTGDAWRTELKNMGYPLQTHNIAISNASHCATPQNLVPLQDLFTLNGNIRTGALTEVILAYLPGISLISGITLAILFDEPALVIAAIPGNSKFSLDFNAKALPTANASGRIYHGRLSFTKTLFKFFGFAPKITVELTNRNYDISGLPSFDYYPGGTNLPFLTSGGSNSNPDLDFLFSVGININAQQTFNFIPTTSALDVGSGNATLSNADYLQKYNAQTPPVGSKAVPFHNFTTSYNTNSTNEQHISFNQRNGDWLATELDDSATNAQIFDCSYMCDDFTITGPAKMCTNGSTYSINAPSTTTAIWTITQGSNLVTMTNNPNGSITLTSQQYSGTVTISALIGNQACGNLAPVTKTITIGNNSTNFNITLIERYCDSNFQYFVLRPNNATISFNGFTNFVPTTGLFTVPFNGTNDAIFRIPKTYSGVGRFDILAENSSCGRFKYTFTIGSIQDCQSIVLPRMSQETTEERYLVYPNPSNNVVYVSLKEENIDPENSTTINAELFDMYGVSKGQISIIDNQAVIDVSYLLEGIYVLRINIDDVIESHEIVVQ